MARRHVNTTRYEIIQTATRLFLEKGYSATSPKQICEALDISTGNLTYYFPTKEHLLAVLIEMLCSFQGKTIHSLVENEGTTSLLAVCLELATMAAMSEESEVARELLLAAYTSPMCLEIIRTNDTKRARYVYKPFCPDWSEEQYMGAEILVSGIEYATLMTTEHTLPLESRIAGALDNIMKIFDVPKEIREQKIRKVLAIDCRAQARSVWDQFRQFVNETNASAFESLFSKPGA